MSQATKTLDSAINFYQHAPDGQYDEIAVIALKACRSYIDNEYIARDDLIEELSGCNHG